MVAAEASTLNLLMAYCEGVNASGTTARLRKRTRTLNKGRIFERTSQPRSTKLRLTVLTLVL